MAALTAPAEQYLHCGLVMGAHANHRRPVNLRKHEELEHIASERITPTIARTGPGFRARVAVQELGQALTLSRGHWGGPMHAVRTGQMAARASTDDLMLFCVQLAGRAHVHQHDRFVELSAGSGVLSETRSRWELVSQAETRSLTLRFSRELLPLRSAPGRSSGRSAVTTG